MPDQLEFDLKQRIDRNERRKAVFEIFSRRRVDLLPVLENVARNESDEELAVLATQVCLSLRDHPPNPALEKEMRDILRTPTDVGLLSVEMWAHLTHGSPKELMIAALRGCRGPLPREGILFLDKSLGHPDPEVRLEACEPAMTTRDAVLFAHVLARVFDPDQRVVQAAFAAVHRLPRSDLARRLDAAVKTGDPWVVGTVARFFPALACEEIRPVLLAVRDSRDPQVAGKAREVLARLDKAKEHLKAVETLMDMVPSPPIPEEGPPAPAKGSVVPLNRSGLPMPKVVPMPREGLPGAGGTASPRPLSSAPSSPFGLAGAPSPGRGGPAPMAPGARLAAPPAGAAPAVSTSPAAPVAPAAPSAPAASGAPGTPDGSFALPSLAAGVRPTPPPAKKERVISAKGRVKEAPAGVAPAAPAGPGSLGDQLVLAARGGPALAHGGPGAPPTLTGGPVPAPGVAAVPPGSTMGMPAAGTPPAGVPPAAPAAGKDAQSLVNEEISFTVVSVTPTASVAPAATPATGSPAGLPMGSAGPVGQAAATAAPAGSAGPVAPLAGVAPGAVGAPGVPPVPGVVPVAPGAAGVAATQAGPVVPAGGSAPLPVAGVISAGPVASAAPSVPAASGTAAASPPPAAPGTPAMPAGPGAPGPSISPAMPATAGPVPAPRPAAPGPVPVAPAMPGVSAGPPPVPAPVAPPAAPVQPATQATAPVSGAPVAPPPTAVSTAVPAASPPPAPAAPVAPLPPAPAVPAAAPSPRPAPAPAVAAPPAAPAKPPAAPAAGQMTLEPPRVAESIMARYPSFLTAPFGRLFEPDTPPGHLETLRTLLEALLGFLNFTFLQTYLFYGTRSPKGDQVVMECLKCHLGGPSAVRSLHHLALVVKNVTGTDSFFTFALSRAMTEAGEANPLMVLKELWEFVLAPVEPLQENLPQAVEALPQVLMAFKGLLHNPLVMKSAPGAREAFFDLSGPRAAPLKPADRPGLDLPPGEIILLSKDRGEALGLFPYFTFNGERIVFAVPEAKQTAILYERLELKEG